jgi:REP element-mobilizing transposase RayT
MIGQIESHRRKPIRLKKYDYSEEGAYFVTVCTRHRACHFGEVKDGIVELSNVGNVAKRNWGEIPDHFHNCRLDQFIVMPNHLHGVITLEHVGVQYIEPLQQYKYQKVIPKSIGSIIRSYKASVTRWCGGNGYELFRWQRNYYEHIIRNEEELRDIREYIMSNPLK